MKRIVTIPIFLVLAGLFPFIILSSIKTPIGIEAVLPLITILLASLMIVDVLNKPTPQYMRLFFWIFVYIMFGAAAVAQITNGFYWREPRINAYSPNLLLVCYGIIWIGVAAYEIGYFVQQKRQTKRMGFSRTKRTNTNQRTGTDFLFVLIILLIAASTLIFMLSQSINLFAFKDLSVKKDLEKFGTVGGAFIDLAGSFLPLYAIHLGINDLRSNKYNLLIKTIYTICVITILVLLMIKSNPLSTSRWWLGTIIISFVLTSQGKKSYTPAFLAVGIPFIYIFAFYYLAVFRSDFHFASILSSDFSVIRNLIDGDFDSLQQTLNTLVYVEYEGLTFGRQLLGVFTFWFPRALWPNKPYNTGEFIARYFGYRYVNLSAPLWAEGYINFGILGTILFLLIWGIISGTLDFSYGHHLSKKGNIDRRDIVMFILTGSQHLLIRGSLLVSSLYILPPMLVVNLWFLIKMAFDKKKIYKLQIKSIKPTIKMDGTNG